MNTFYTSPRGTDRSNTVLQCSLKSSTLTPKLYSLRNIFPNDLPVSALNRPSFVPVCVSVLGLGLTDPVLGLLSRCSACLSTLPLKLNLRLFGIFGLTALVPPGSSTCSTLRASTLPVGLSAHTALVSSPAVAVLGLFFCLGLG